MNSPKVNEKLSRSQSTKKMVLSPSCSQERIDDEDTSSAQVTERAKADRIVATKQDEDRRRRTIIVEKKNGSFGFTLQSYGIHYKKEQEIEMITYVDYVEYDGPAFKAGMREGDVILSINGHDMEKADHKSLVNFIKNCDTRMRMVVLFEDCVRKVELHIRYIQLQRILQSKTEELDKLCSKERELLQGKWKSHSLPARKKGNSATQCQINSPCQEEPYCRPTVSTEDVAHAPNQPQLLLAYQYLDPRYQYVLRSDSSNKLLLSWNQDSQDSEPIVLTPNCDKQKQCRYKNYYETNGTYSSEVRKTRPSGKAKNSQPQSKHLCTSCMQTVNSQDNTSVEAYDLASPCCDPHCVPSAKRKLKHQKHKHQSKSHDHNSSKENEKSGPVKVKNREGKEKTSKPGNQQRYNKYFNFGSNLVSQFSLHSCTSSDISNSVQVAGSGASYTTSLSSDTLFWDNNDNKTCSKSHSYSRTSSYKSRPASDSYQSLQSAKPKSWDNLTKKAFGGYGFGYDYIDACGPSKSQSNSSTCTSSSNTMPVKMKSNSKTNAVKVNLNQINFKSKSGGRVHSIQIYHNGHRHYIPPTKSSESLLQKQTPLLTNSSLSCECLEIGSPFSDNNIINKKFLPFRSEEVSYCHQEKTNQAVGKQRQNREPSAGTVSRL